MVVKLCTISGCVLNESGINDVFWVCGTVIYVTAQRLFIVTAVATTITSMIARWIRPNFSTSHSFLAMRPHGPVFGYWCCCTTWIYADSLLNVSMRAYIPELQTKLHFFQNFLRNIGGKNRQIYLEVKGLIGDMGVICPWMSMKVALQYGYSGHVIGTDVAIVPLLRCALWSFNLSNRSTLIRCSRIGSELVFPLSSKYTARSHSVKLWHKKHISMNQRKMAKISNFGISGFDKFSSFLR